VLEYIEEYDLVVKKKGGEPRRLGKIPLKEIPSRLHSGGGKAAGASLFIANSGGKGGDSACAVSQCCGGEARGKGARRGGDT